MGRFGVEQEAERFTWIALLLEPINRFGGNDFVVIPLERAPTTKCLFLGFWAPVYPWMVGFKYIGVPWFSLHFLYAKIIKTSRA